MGIDGRRGWPPSGAAILPKSPRSGSATPGYCLPVRARSDPSPRSHPRGEAAFVAGATTPKALRRRRSAAKHGGDRRHQPADADRLGDIIVHARGQAAVAVVRQGVGGHGHDGDMPALALRRWRIRRVASKPSICGICTSMRTMSKRSSASRARTSSPLAATATAWPRRVRIS